MEVMKKMNTLLVSAAVLGVLAVPVQALAADGGTYNTRGLIEFEPSDGPTDPVDPEKPTDPVKPVDPIDPNKPVDPGTNGPLSIDFASSLNFGKQKISSKNEVYYAAAQTYHKYDAEGNVIEELTTGPNYVQVTDNRGTEAGWTLKVKQNGQFKNGEKELTGAVITFKNGHVVTASDSKKPTAQAIVSLDADGSETDMMSAASGEGAGTYLTDWGTASNADKSIELSVPGSTTKYAGKYNTTMTWTLTDVPGNNDETPGN